MDIEKTLFQNSDEKYKKFNSSLIPTVDREKFIGVRTPVLRKMAKEIYRSDLRNEFLDSLPHKYYEENNLHAYVIEQIKDFDECIGRLEEFLPYVDNWATCDSMTPKVFAKHKTELLEKIEVWLKSRHTYTVRYAIRMLMCFFLDEDFDEKYLEKVSLIRSDEYYIKMMVAWYFATALAKQYDSAVKYIENHTLDDDVHKMTIQKAVDSFRVTDDQKAYVKTMRKTK